MTAARCDLIIDQGADFTAQIYWLDQEQVPYVLAPPILMDIRKSNGDLVDSFKAGVIGDNNASDLTYTASNGMIQLYINPSRTAAMQEGSYYYDMFTNYIDSNGGVTRTARLIYGTVEVRKRVTQNG